MSISPAIAGVILAAGESSRMGRDKALLPYQGSTFLGAAIERLTPFCELVIVVAGKNAEALKQVVFSEGAFIIENPHPKLGQFSSLRAGLHEVLNRGRDTALITLVDRPPASAETIAALLARFRASGEETWAVVPEITNSATGKPLHGHPIVPGREIIGPFLPAPADSNARKVQHANQSRIVYLPVTDTGVTVN